MKLSPLLFSSFSLSLYFSFQNFDTYQKGNQLKLERRKIIWKRKRDFFERQKLEEEEKKEARKLAKKLIEFE